MVSRAYSVRVRAGLALVVFGPLAFLWAPVAAQAIADPGFAIRASQSSPVTGAVTLSAAVPAEPGLIGVQFKVDGYVLEALATTSPYEISWSAASAANGDHTVTAEARYTSGEVIRSAPLQMTVANPAAFNRTLYVDAANGDDAFDGLSPNTAWRTLDQANQSVVAGDTVVLLGTFTGQRIAPNASGTAATPITFTSYPGTTAVLDVGRVGRAVVLNGGRSYIVIERLRIQNVPGYAIAITGLWPRRSDHPGQRQPRRGKPDGRHRRRGDQHRRQRLDLGRCQPEPRAQQPADEWRPQPDPGRRRSAG
ncbi:MAG: hypothetical protein AUH14_11300 [Candidatus Rokubacteria bacterium 13_2_20CM_69_15_1]|nr:MAG: hypothetical protein AUH14_11300 [Candidatus Rokubacteria bacterium 13_2_20CM_69_15_1]